MSKPNRFPVKRIAIDAVLIALYFGLSWASVEIAGIKLDEFANQMFEAGSE